jgi:hypothetical protein
MHLIDKMETQKMGLMINYEHTKHMETGKPTKQKYIKINNTDTEKDNKLQYLGFIITTNNITSKINHRINMGNKRYCGLRNIFR